MLSKSFVLFMFSVVFLNAGTIVGQIYQIRDGDTMDFQTEQGILTCRVLGIDTPEKYESNKLIKEANKFGIDASMIVNAGELATSYAYEYFSSNLVYALDIDGQDRYGRNLCIISDERGSYNENIVADGYSVVYKNGKYIKDRALRHKLQVAQGNAVKANSGLWADFKILMKKMANN